MRRNLTAPEKWKKGFFKMEYAKHRIYRITDFYFILGNMQQFIIVMVVNGN